MDRRRCLREPIGVPPRARRRLTSAGAFSICFSDLPASLRRSALFRRGVEHAHHMFGGQQREQRRDRLGHFLDRAELRLRQATSATSLSVVSSISAMTPATRSTRAIWPRLNSAPRFCSASTWAAPRRQRRCRPPQMMVEEGERRADGERMEPKRDFGEFHRHGILVDAVDDALKHHAADDMAVVELAFDDRPSVRARLTEDFRAHRGDAGGERRNVVAPFHERRGFRHRAPTLRRPASRPGSPGSARNPSQDRRPSTTRSPPQDRARRAPTDARRSVVDPRRATWPPR